MQNNKIFTYLLLSLSMLFALSCLKIFDSDHTVKAYVKAAKQQAHNYLAHIKNGQLKPALNFLENHLREDKSKYFNYELIFNENFIKQGHILNFNFINSSHEIFYSHENNQIISNIAIYLHYEIIFSKNKKNYVFILTRKDLPNEHFKIDSIHPHNPGHTLIGKY